MTLRLTLIAAVLVVASRAEAQNITVQQPVMRTFGVGTTVVAPDRGGAYAAGVRRAADSRFRGGFFPQPAAVGREMSGGNVTVHAWIHDLREMDEQVLASAPATVDDTAGLSEDAAHAARSLARNYGQSTESKRSPVVTPVATSRQSSSLASAYRIRAQHLSAQGKSRLAESYLRLAQQAERPATR